MQNIHLFRTSAAFAVAVLMSACAGTNALRVTSDPSGAVVVANGVSIGKTPVTVPQKWAGLGGDAVKLVLYKEGYQSMEKTVSNAELAGRWLKGDKAAGSEYGLGATFPIHIRLEPKSGSAASSPRVIIQHVPVPVEKKPDWR